MQSVFDTTKVDNKGNVTEVTGEPPEVWTINRCNPNYIQMYSMSNGSENFIHDTTIYFDRLKYSSECGGELILYLNDLTIARIDMENKRVVLGEGVDLLELLNQQQKA